MTRVVQRTFASGALAPDFFGQSDQDFYRAGARTLENVVVTKEGSLRKRSGLEHVSAEGGLRLFRFGASDGSDFIVSLGSTVRIFRDGLEQSINPPAWALGLYPPYSFVTHNGATYANYDAWTDTEPGAEGSAWDTESLPQPPAYSAADRAQLKSVQLGDVLTITCKGHEPFQVTRGTGGWTFGAPSLAAPLHDIDDFINNSTGLAVSLGAEVPTSDDWHFERDWTWIVTAVYQENGMWRETVSQQTVSLSCCMTPDFRPRRVTIPNTGSLARSYRIYRGYNGLYGLVGEVAGATSGSSDFWDKGENPDTTKQPPVRLGSDALYEDSTSAPEYEEALKPNVVAFWNQRMLLAGFTAGPATLLVGGTDSLHDFTQNPMLDPGDGDGAELSLAACEHEEIRAIVPAAELLVLTSRGEWVVKTDGPVTPRSLTARRNSARGIGNVPPLVVGGHVLFVSRSGAVYALALDSDSGEWAQHDLTALASHLFEGKRIVDWTYQQRPDSIIWCVLDDGSFLSLTYRPEAGIIAWASHTTTGGTAYAVAVAEEDGADVVYFSVLRGAALYLEKIHDVDSPDSVQDGFYLDAARTWPDSWGATPGLPSAGSYLPLGSGTEMAATVGGVNYGLRIYGTARQAVTLAAKVTTGGAPGTAQLRWTVGGVTYPAVVYRGGLQLLSDFIPLESVRGLTLQHLPGPFTDPTDFVLDDEFSQTIAAAGMANEQPDDFDSVQIPAAFAGGTVDVFETVELRPAVTVDANGFFALTDTSAERVIYGSVYSATVELLNPPDQKGSPALELVWLAARCSTAGAPALRPDAATATGGQPEEAVTLEQYAAGTDVSRRTIEGTLAHALEGEVAGAIVQTYPYPLRILWVARDVEFQSDL